MSEVQANSLLNAVLDSWDRNNTILVNLLRAIPADALHARPAEGSPSILGLFAHIHYVRSVFVSEDAPDLAREVPQKEWEAEQNAEQLARALDESALAVRDAVEDRVNSGREMAMHYDHPILMLQHMIWHEGYHHGQIKLTLKLVGKPISDRQASPITWGVWMRKKKR